MYLFSVYSYKNKYVAWTNAPYSYSYNLSQVAMPISRWAFKIRKAKQYICGSSKYEGVYYTLKH